MRINTKLSACKAATIVQIKSLLSLEYDGKTSKDLLRRTLALLLDAAEACVLSSWRKLKICEELFSSLLNGITQITVTRGGQLLRVLLIPLKPLVLTTCAQVCYLTLIKLRPFNPAILTDYCFLLQADIWGSSRGAMFETITKISCEIIEFGWSKDRALVDTFIMGLAACLRERNDYEEQVCFRVSIIGNKKKFLMALCCNSFEVLYQGDKYQVYRLWIYDVDHALFICLFSAFLFILLGKLVHCMFLLNSVFVIACFYLLCRKFRVTYLHFPE